MKPINRKKIYAGYSFDLFEDQVIWVNGKKLERVFLQHPGISVMLPVLDPDHLILVNQYRYGAQKNLWELPAGTINAGEEPLLCAQRELKEEIGYAAGKWVPLTACYSSPHFSSELIHAFLAKDLTKTENDLDDDEVIEVGVFTKPEVQSMIRSGKIMDAKSLITLLTYFNQVQ